MAQTISALSHLMILGVFMSILALVTQYNHLLNVLLSLEAMVLNLFGLILFQTTTTVALEEYMCLIMITLGACEASMGLAMLVTLIRSHGNDYVSSFSAHKF
uniref:NADH-ubiquinone oxidoreductase chain 4L n=1 Tax=Phasianella australis TaxID=335753 RepID=A0A1D8MGI2_9VEST|nr:NADH dehydrogenase subunit 4L [Phasianella australis]